ncbi:MAG: class I SAM-dependent methyltransferase [Candidatus Binatia bacterium]
MRTDATHRHEANFADAPCQLCGTRGVAPYTREPGEYRVVVCTECGLGRTEPQPPDGILEPLYKGEYTSADARKFGGPIEAVRRFFVRALARRIARRIGGHGGVLDVGCGDGKLLVALAAEGFRGTGVELHSRVDERLPPGSTIKVFVGTLEQARFPDASFRVVILRHVLEHVRDPLATLTEVRRLIEPGGHLVIAVPNLASWQSRVSRHRWFHLDLPRHLFHFTPASLALALERTGFRVARLSHFSFEQNPYGWLQSAFNAAGGRWGALYHQIRARGSAHAQPARPLVIAAATALMPVCVTLATIESAAGHGGAIEAWAQPV